MMLDATQNYNKPLDEERLLGWHAAHFRFIIIHPFDDGNGRIARAVSGLLLARSDDSPKRFYSLSNQILTAKSSGIYRRTVCYTEDQGGK